MPPKKFKVLNGINYIPQGKTKEVRREIGAKVADIPPKSLAIYLKRGDVEPYDGTED